MNNNIFYRKKIQISENATYRYLLYNRVIIYAFYGTGNKNEGQLF